METRVRRRRWLGATAVLASTGVSAACAVVGSRGGDAALPPAAKPTGPIEVWHQWSTRQPQLRVYLDQFERENPGAKVNDVEMATIGANGSDRTKIVASIIGGTVPDVLMVFNNMYHLVVPSKAVVGLNSYIARDKVDLKAFIDAEVQLRTFNGQLVTMPSAAATAQSLFWNKAHFRQAGLDPTTPPRTWSQVEQFAQRLTIGAAGAGAGGGGRQRGERGGGERAAAAGSDAGRLQRAAVRERGAPLHRRWA